ncbi:MAG: hypothetical protein ABFD49_05185 [Armatimonadota bacterium]|nr:hypothetical protein [bacterium]
MRMNWRAIILLCAVIWSLPALCMSAEEKHPAETTQVTSEGEAPASVGDARDKAIADALRNAVMKVIGVYIDSTTIGRGYEVVCDDILMKSGGFATLDEVISTSTKGDLFKVAIKATVSNRPLAERLKALGLTRQWSVGIVTSNAAVETAICRQLVSAGFRVIDDTQRKRLHQNAAAAQAVKGDAESLMALGREFNVDIIVAGQAKADYVDNDDYGGITLYRSRARMDAKAYYTDTGEILSVIDSSADAIDQTKDLSAESCLAKVGDRAGNLLANDLMIAPAAMSAYMTVRIAGFKGIMAANKLEEATRDLPGVIQVKRQRYSGGVLEMNVCVKSDYRNELPALIEKCSTGKKLGIAIDSCSKTCVQGRAYKSLDL